MMPATPRLALADPPKAVRGTLVLCNSPLDTERVTATLLHRFGSDVEAAQDLDSALLALAAGASAVVCADAHRAEELPSVESWPPTIVLGTTFVDTELSAIFDRAGREAIAAYSSTDQAELDRELERAFRYLEGPRRSITGKRRGPRDIVGAILQATGAAAASQRRAATREAKPAATESFAPSRTRVLMIGGGSLPAMLAFLPALAVAVAVWVSVADHVSQPARIPTTGHPAAFEWDHRIFFGEREFTAWLKSRGVSFDAWARNHPGAARMLEHPTTPRRP
jgi:hypothetical protein